MKILSVQFRNINSLKGEWKIDFTESPFIENALFAITGPTGAGKTTILDAICLALYHKTPRIKVVSSSSNELMTRGTGECSAEVVFAVKSVEYIASWSMKRARGKADGKLQGALVSLAQRDSGEILASQIKPKLETIESLTGLDFERFTKSMLLSQGDFAAFLNAEEGERAELLEELTGTEIYGLISQQVHQQFTEVKQQKELLDTKSQAIELLSEQDKNSIGLTQTDNKLRTDKLQKERTGHRSQLIWWNGLHTIKQQLEQAEQGKRIALQAVEQSLPLRQQLTQAEQAKQLQPAFDEQQRLLSQRQGIERSEQELSQKHNSIEQQRPILEAHYQETTQRLAASRAALEHFEAHIVSQVAPLDKQIDLESQQLKKTKLQHTTLLEQHNGLQNQIVKQSDLKHQLEQQIEHAKAYKERFGLDHQLEQNLPLWQHQLSDIEQLSDQLNEHNAEVDKYAKQDLQFQQTLDAKLKNKQQLLATQAPSQSNLEDLAQEIAKGLGHYQGEIDVLHNAVEAARQTQQIANDLNREQTLALNLRQQMLDSQKNVQDFSAQQRANQQQRDTLVIEYREAEKQVNWLTKIVNQAETIVSLRSELTSDTPCVVCGSKHHDTDASMATDVAIEQAQLKEQAKRLKEVTELGQAIGEQQAVLKQKLTHEQQLLEQLQPQYDAAVMQWQALVEQLANGDKAVTLSVDDLDQTTVFAKECSKQFEQLNQQYSSLQSKQREQRVMEESMQKAALQIQSLDDEIRSIESDKQSIAQSLKHAQTMLLNVTKEAQDKSKRLTVLISDYLEPLQTDQPIDFISSLKVLAERAGQWRDNEEVLLKASSALKEATQTLEQYLKNDTQWRAELSTLHTELTQKQSLLTELGDKRFTLLGTQSIEKARDELKQAVTRSEEHHKQVSDQQQVAQVQLTQVVTELNSLSQQSLKLAEQIKIASQHWQHSLEQSNFDDQEQFIQASQWYGEMSTWTKQLSDTQQQLTHAEGEWSAIDKQLNAHQSNKPVDIANEAECQSALTRCDEELESIQQQMGELKNRLEMDKKRQQQAADLVEELKRFTVHYDDIAYLHGLIGSSSGDKFRKFAQSLTLDNLVYLANQRLAQLHGRYRLKRNHNTDLQFNVIDSWQADVERDTKTLSGGESFLVSLALALALSDLVSHKTSIDSLFLDEGFGTLDTETLDIALDALDNLQTSGKMIGIISHIDALKERIPTQIVVSKKSGLGVSELASRYRIVN